MNYANIKNIGHITFYTLGSTAINLAQVETAVLVVDEFAPVTINGVQWSGINEARLKKAEGIKEYLMNSPVGEYPTRLILRVAGENVEFQHTMPGVAALIEILGLEVHPPYWRIGSVPDSVLAE